MKTRTINIEIMDWEEYAKVDSDTCDSYMNEWFAYYEIVNELTDEDYDRQRLFEDGLNEWVHDVIASAILTYDGSCEWDNGFDGVSKDAITFALTAMMESNSSR